MFVVAPGGYVGRTTCYEIGRIIQENRPLYFSESPQDLPLYVPKSHVFALDSLIRQLGDHTLNVTPLYEGQGDNVSVAEKALIRGCTWTDDQFNK